MRARNRLQDRIHAAYLDKLHGRTDAGFFDQIANDWRNKQAQCLGEIERHRSVGQSYLVEGVKHLEVARNAQRLFVAQNATEHLRLLGVLVSNCSWRNGELTATLRQPFDLLAETANLHAAKKATGAVSSGLSGMWLGELDSNQH